MTPSVDLITTCDLENIAKECVVGSLKEEALLQKTTLVKQGSGN